MALFDEFGVQFDYPEDWEVDTQVAERERSIFLQGPGSAFVMVSVLDGRPTTTHVLDTAEEALKSEYDDCEVEEPAAEMAGVTADARDIDFTCHDLVSTARLRAIQGEQQTVLLMGQRADIEADEADPVFDRIAKSLKLPTGGAIA